MISMSSEEEAALMEPNDIETEKDEQIMDESSSTQEWDVPVRSISKKKSKKRAK